jgi:hypothetical protein
MKVAPDEEHEYIPQILKPLAESRRQANGVKRAEPITVVIGNPPDKEKAKGKGGWIESGNATSTHAQLPPFHTIQINPVNEAG